MPSSTERKTSTLRQAKFTLDESPTFVGWTDGTLWNGFATPAFEKAVADQVASFIFSQGDHESVLYDFKGDRYLFVTKAEIVGGGKRADRTDTFNGYDRDGKHLYAIGSWVWTWWEVTIADLTGAREFNTVHDVESFIRSCVDFFGLGFHPDTAGADYVEFESDKKTFTAAQAKAFDANMERAFAASERLHVDLYAIGNDLFSQVAQA